MLNRISWDKYTLGSIGGALWLLVCIDPFFMWIMPKSPWYILALGLVFLATMQFIKNGDLQTTNSRKALALLVILFCIYVFLKKPLIGPILQFMPFIMLVMWSQRATYGVYRYFRYIIIFFSVLTIINSALLFVGVTVPYISVQGMSSAHYLSDTVLRIHALLTVSPVNIFSGTDDLLIRACGPLQEGGHFGIILGIILIIDNLTQHKMNKVIVITGILTFSPAFMILFLSAIAYNFFCSQYKFAKVFTLGVGIMLCTLVFISLPDTITDKIVYTLYERNLETVITSAMEHKSLVGALSERTSIDGEYLYYQFQKADMFTKIFGVGEVGEEIVLSDYRCTIARLGYFGFSLILVLGLFCCISRQWKFMLMMSIPFILVLIHRSWMLDSAYIHYLCFCGVVVNTYLQSQQTTKSILTDNNDSAV